MMRRPPRRVEAGHVVAGLAFAALLLMLASLCQLLAQGSTR